jgi:V8-like Glu-specific endopeptidase
MANDRYGSTAIEKGAGQGPAADEDVLSGGGASGRAAPTMTTRGPTWAPTETQFAMNEVAGEEVASRPPSAGEAHGTHDEVGSAEATEAGEEYIEASPAQLAAAAAEAGEETAVSDLRKIEGYEPREAAQEGAPLPQQLFVKDAGTATGAAGETGQEEFLPILAALAPTLISTVGPAVAKGVMSRLSPRTRKVITNLKKTAAPVVSKAVTGAAKGAGGKAGVLALLSKLLETAQQAPGNGHGGESGVEVEEAFVTEAAAAIEVIIGTDDRIKITQTTQIPWRRLCALRITFPSGSTFRGTGFLVGPRAVATAGHCVYLHNQGGWARRIEVIPGCNGTTRPFGQVESTQFRSVGGWVNERKPESDYGCVILPSGAFGGRNLGSFGFAAFESTTLLAQPGVVAGYPGDKPFAELWGMSRIFKAVTAQTLVYDIDTMGGQSGAPVYIMRNGQRYVVGIHNYGAASGNSATRVTQPVYQRLLGWSKI